MFQVKRSPKFNSDLNTVQNGSNTFRFNSLSYKMFANKL